MSQAIAFAEAQRMKAAIERRGVTVSIELQPGTDGSWHRGGRRGLLEHHIASRPSQGLTPGLGLVKRGRAGLSGPLCNGYGGFDLVYRIITFGPANHAGKGGPLQLAGHIPANNGNSLLWGTEFEGGYEQYTAQMREFMSRAIAGLLDYHGGWGVNGTGEHKTWTSRKVDRIGYTTQSARDEVQFWMGQSGSINPITNVPAPVGGGGGGNPWAGKNGNAEYVNGSRTLRLYSAGTDVKTVQRAVGASQDGLYGNDTVAKVKVYQRARGLAADGITGPQTWRAILGGGNAHPAPVTNPAAGNAPAFPLPRGWYFGPQSGPKESVSGYHGNRENLRRWQQQMQARGWKITADGLYGPNTEAIARKFQAEKGLAVDGKIGRETWAAAWNAPVT